MKTGVLKQNTYIHTLGGITFKVRKGTKVTADRGVLTFNPNPIRITRMGKQFYAIVSGISMRIYFPEGGVFYPLSML